MEHRRRILVVGGGAIGLSYASLLCRTCDVSVLVRPGRAQEFRSRRVRVLHRDGVGRHAALPDDYRFVEEADGAAEADVILVCVKSYDTAEVAKRLADAGTSAVVVTVQNGLGNREILTAALPRASVRVGATYVASTRVAPDVFEILHLGPTFVEGDGAADAAPLAEAFAAAHLPFEFRAEIDEMLWNKLALAAGASALAALCRTPLEPFANPAAAPQLAAVATQAVRECATVMEAKGLRLVAEPDALVVEAAQRAPRNLSSMLQDILARKRTEVDAINGAVAAEAALLGLPAPTNCMLTALVHALEETSPWR